MVVKCSRAVIAPTSASIKAGGLAGEPIKLTLDIYPDSVEQITDILNLRGKELVAVFATIDDAESLPSDTAELGGSNTGGRATAKIKRGSA